MQDVLSYLDKQRGRNLELILSGLRRVYAKYRFDSQRFDILAFNINTEVFYGITELRAAPTEKSVEKLLGDAEWLKGYEGKSIMLIPNEKKEYGGLFAEPAVAEYITPKYYLQRGKEYAFSDTPIDKVVDLVQRRSELVKKMIMHPQVINFALRKMEKKSPIIGLARLAYNTYMKVK